MNDIVFDWDPNKNDRNKIVHKISFEEAQTAFYDENARIISDDKHSELEQRFILLGYSFRANLLIVCHCYREEDEVIRIISARKATKTETSQYYNFKGR